MPREGKLPQLKLFVLRLSKPSPAKSASLKSSKGRARAQASRTISSGSCACELWRYELFELSNYHEPQRSCRLRGVSNLQIGPCPSRTSEMQLGKGRACSHGALRASLEQTLPRETCIFQVPEGQSPSSRFETPPERELRLQVEAL